MTTVTTQYRPVLRTIADVAEELMQEYGDHISLAMITEIVLGAHRDLLGQVPEEALTELLYRLARQRLGA